MSEPAQLLTISLLGCALLLGICLGASIVIRWWWFQVETGGPPPEEGAPKGRKRKK